MAKRIPVSFKEEERDLKLYEYVLKQGDKSCFVKNAIEFYIENLNSKLQLPRVENTNNNFIYDENETDGIGEIMGF